MQTSLRLAADQAPATVPGRTDRTASELWLTFHRGLAASEADWRALERDSHHTVYQTFGWVEAWQATLGDRAGIAPLIVVAKDDAGQPCMLWPFGIRRVGPLRLGCWLGGKHANYNMGLYRHDFLPGLSRDRLLAALRRTAQAERLDGFVLLNQPFVWQGRDNPFIVLPRQDSAADAWQTPLEGDAETVLNALCGSSTRQRLRRREKRLAEAAGPLRLERARDASAAQAVVDVFLAQKTARFRRQQKANAFDEPGAADFAHALTRTTGRPGAALDLYALHAGETLVATLGGGTANGRFSCYFNSIAVSDLDRFGPGELIIAKILQCLRAEGVSTFDLGIGELRYKKTWCKPEPLFDTFLPVGLKGRPVLAALALAYRAKRAARGNPALMKLVHRAQGLTQGGRSERGEPDDAERS